MRYVVLTVVFLVAACSEPPVPYVYTGQSFDVEALSQGDFYAVPFPDNQRLLASSSAGLEYFPNPGELAILQTYKQAFSDHYEGFGLNSAIYMRFDGPISTATLPQSARATLEDHATVRLLDIDPESPQFGFPVPVTLHYQSYAGRYIDEDTLVALPYPGHGLRDGTTYALLVDQGVLDAEGIPLVQAEGLRARLQAPDASGLKKLGIDTDTIAAAAIFTTRNATAKLFAFADYLRDNPELVGWESMSDPTTWIYTDGTRCHEITGRFLAPNFQHGEIPYRTTGGGFHTDANGTPIVAHTDSIRYTLRLPEDYDPQAGMPYVVYAHGTGGDYQSVRGITNQMCKRGIASIGADQPLHGDRLTEGEPSLWTFNLFNPVAMVHNFLQGGLESVALAMLMEQLTIPAGQSPYGIPVTMDATRQMFMGHSQGSLTGAPTLAADGRNFAGAVYSGSSGGLALALLYKVEPINFPVLLELGLGTVGEFDLFHPALNLFQMFGEPADPLNYARYILQEPRPGVEDDWRPLHLFQTEGIVDKYTVPEQSEALSVALGVEWVGPQLQTFEPLQELYDIQPAPRPFSGNLQYDGKNYTAAVVQYPLGHFSVYDDPDAWQDFADFLEDVSQGEIPTIR